MHEYRKEARRKIWHMILIVVTAFAAIGAVTFVRVMAQLLKERI